MFLVADLYAKYFMIKVFSLLALEHFVFSLFGIIGNLLINLY